MSSLFNVTHETWTHEDVEIGDTDDRGFYLENVSLREAYDFLRWEGSCEANAYPVRDASWLSFYGEADFRTGDTTIYSLHIPDAVTPSSRLRIAKLFHCYGVK